MTEAQIADMMKENAALKLIVGAIVVASGGSVKVPISSISEDAEPIPVERWVGDEFVSFEVRSAKGLSPL